VTTDRIQLAADMSWPMRSLIESQARKVLWLTVASIVLGLVVALVSFAVGFEAGTLLAILLVAASQVVIRVRYGTGLRASTAMYQWLAEHELVDADGRLTDIGLSQYPLHVEADATPAQVNLDAYRRSYEAVQVGADWQRPLVAAARRRPSPISGKGISVQIHPSLWLLIGPLALVGAVLMVLAAASVIVFLLQPGPV